MEMEKPRPSLLRAAHMTFGREYYHLGAMQVGYVGRYTTDATHHRQPIYPLDYMPGQLLPVPTDNYASLSVSPSLLPSW